MTSKSQSSGYKEGYKDYLQNKKKEGKMTPSQLKTLEFIMSGNTNIKQADTTRLINVLSKMDELTPDIIDAVVNIEKTKNPNLTEKQIKAKFLKRYKGTVKELLKNDIKITEETKEDKHDKPKKKKGTMDEFKEKTNINETPIRPANIPNPPIQPFNRNYQNPFIPNTNQPAPNFTLPVAQPYDRRQNIPFAQSTEVQVPYGIPYNPAIYNNQIPSAPSYNDALNYTTVYNPNNKRPSAPSYNDGINYPNYNPNRPTAPPSQNVPSYNDAINYPKYNPNNPTNPYAPTPSNLPNRTYNLPSAPPEEKQSLYERASDTASNLYGKASDLYGQASDLYFENKPMIDQLEKTFSKKNIDNGSWFTTLASLEVPELAIIQQVLKFTPIGASQIDYEVINAIASGNGDKVPESQRIKTMLKTIVNPDLMGKVIGSTIEQGYNQSVEAIGKTFDKAMGRKPVVEKTTLENQSADAIKKRLEELKSKDNRQKYIDSIMGTTTTPTTTSPPKNAAEILAPPDISNFGYHETTVMQDLGRFFRNAIGLGMFEGPSTKEEIHTIFKSQ
jgi:hypothetical protein